MFVCFSSTRLSRSGRLGEQSHGGQEEAGRPETCPRRKGGEQRLGATSEICDWYFSIQYVCWLFGLITRGLPATAAPSRPSN